MPGHSRVLFLCVHNSARSQMAEGILNAFGGARYEAFSAGLVPTPVRKEAVAVMEEIGIDMTGHHSKDVASFVGQAIDVAVTVCDEAKEACPVFPSARKQLHWSISDPGIPVGSEGDQLGTFRMARDEILARIKVEFLQEA